MFEAQRLLGDTTRSIVLQTRAGGKIVNEITLPPTPGQIKDRENLAKKFPAWENRKPPTGGYNCAGHVWAARRTGIFDDFDDQVMTILKDDGYRLLAVGEELKRGDLALYWEFLSPRKNLYHVGMIFDLRSTRELLGLESAASPRSALIPWVLSKPDAFSGEILHHERHVYFYPDAKYSIEYWTDRP